MLPTDPFGLLSTILDRVDCRPALEDELANLGSVFNTGRRFTRLKEDFAIGPLCRKDSNVVRWTGRLRLSVALRCNDPYHIVCARFGRGAASRQAWSLERLLRKGWSQ